MKLILYARLMIHQMEIVFHAIAVLLCNKIFVCLLEMISIFMTAYI